MLHIYLFWRGLKKTCFENRDLYDRMDWKSKLKWGKMIVEDKGDKYDTYL